MQKINHCILIAQIVEENEKKKKEITTKKCITETPKVNRNKVFVFFNRPTTKEIYAVVPSDMAETNEACTLPQNELLEEMNKKKFTHDR